MFCVPEPILGLFTPASPFLRKEGRQVICTKMMFQCGKRGRRGSYTRSTIYSL